MNVPTPAVKCSDFNGDQDNCRNATCAFLKHNDSCTGKTKLLNRKYSKPFNFSCILESCVRETGIFVRGIMVLSGDSDTDLDGCEKQCLETFECQAYTFLSHICFMYSSITMIAEFNGDLISGMD